MGIKICNRIIEYSFYLLFFLVSLIVSNKTSELFELNKMWFTWGLIILIVASWLIKMVLQKKFLFRRTPLDIPIALFLFSQMISTIFSLDPHVSLWGYYSRFNGGLLSIISYILLYYAFLSNFKAGDTIGRVTDSAHLREATGALAGEKVEAGPAVGMAKRLLKISLVSGTIVALWGLPSHFGYDPTCLIFRGTFDVSCWTNAFQPKVRIFSTMGQPDWLAAYLAILIPIPIAFLINNLKLNPLLSAGKYQILNIKYYVSNKNLMLATCCALLATLFYVDLIYTGSRSGFLATWISIFFLAVLYFRITAKAKTFFQNRLKSSASAFLKDVLVGNKVFISLIAALLIITFIIGSPISQLDKFTFGGIVSHFQKAQPAKTANNPAPISTSAQSFETGGGTESGKIRLFVWQGAINAWLANPIFGTGVETFTFAYYKYKPIGQNLTSEWDFIYNKAHNEYLNYLATTGIVGLVTYLSMIIVFLLISIRYLVCGAKEKILNTALIASYISILITNFFGFSVVLTNIYLFIIPAFVFVLAGQLKTETPKTPVNKAIKIDDRSPVWQWTPIFFITVVGTFMLFSLFRFWQADAAYALGSGLDSMRDYQQANPYLRKAAELKSGEPIFQDSLSVNDANIAIALISQNQEDEKTKEQIIKTASSLAQEAININNDMVSHYPNNVNFWKSRARIFSILSQADSKYLPKTLDALKKAYLLAPNDARILYNLGVSYGQNDDANKGIEILQQATEIKPNYRDAYYALGLFYHQLATDKNGKIIDSSIEKKAIDQMQYILDRIAPRDEAALSFIKNWSK